MVRARSCVVALALVLTVLSTLSARPAAALQWQPFGMSGVACTDVRVDTDHERVLVGTLEGFHFWDRATAQWTDRDEPGWIGRTVWSIIGDPDDAQVAITGRENAFFKGYLERTASLGTDGEVVHASQGGAFVGLAHDGQFFYACGISDITPGELMRSADGIAWTPLSGFGHTAMTDVESLYGDLLVVGGNDQVWLSEDRGDTWQDIGAGLGSAFVECVLPTVGPGELLLPTILAGGPGGLWSTEWPYDQWNPLVADPIVDLAELIVPAPFPQNQVSRIAAVTADGRVLVSDTWVFGFADETGDLPAAAVAVAADPWDRGFVVATATDGVYRVADVIAGASPPAAPTTLRAWPNPFNPRVTVRWELPAPARGRLAVYDLAGRHVATLREGAFGAGSGEVVWQPVQRSSGVYLARLEVGGVAKSVRLVLVR
jgi:hypothetical protein